MATLPKAQKDLLLAPVAVEIDSNLRRIRGRSAHEIGAELELELDKPAIDVDHDARKRLVLRQALRNVDMHGWRATITDDGSSVRLDGGSVSIDLGLGADVTEYIRTGCPS